MAKIPVRCVGSKDTDWRKQDVEKDFNKNDLMQSYDDCVLETEVR